MLIGHRLLVFEKAWKCTAWKVSKYVVFSDPYFLIFRLNTGNTDQKRLRIWTLFTQWCIQYIQKQFFRLFASSFKIRCPEVFCQKAVQKIFGISAGRHLRRSSIFATLLKKCFIAGVFLSVLIFFLGQIFYKTPADYNFRNA